MVDYTKRNIGAAPAAQFEGATYDQGLRQHMLRVYNYMAVALLLSGITAWFTASSEALVSAIFGSPLAYVVMLAPLGMVLFLSFRINKMSYSAAQITFWIYSVVMGVSLSSIFLMYTTASIAKVFFITGSVFGAMSLYGYTTKKDLSGMGSILFMGLIGIILASIVNIFLASPALEFAVSIVGVLIFVGLTAYDTQKIKNIYYQVAGQGEVVGKAAIMGALSLYLDFINLLLMLLRFFGDRR